MISTELSERRKNERHHTFWLAKLKAPEVWGYLVDISNTGVKIWLDTRVQQSLEPFEVIIYASESSHIESIPFQVKTVWENIDLDSQTKEIGCEFIHMTSAQEKQVSRLIHFFQLEKDSFLSELIEYLEEDMAAS